MKKLLSVILSAAVLLSVSVLYAFADNDAPVSGATPDEVSSATSDEAAPAPAEVYVTINDAEGKTAVAAAKITVTDTDSDGALTVSDALYAAHEEFYEGGAAAGYATSVSQYGLGLQKLWGAANGGSYGYYVNNASAWSLTDPVKEGDYVAAFVYTDLVGWSDHYSYFDCFKAEALPGDPITLTYSEAAYDEQWMPVTLPVAGAVISVNSEPTDIQTDAEGKAAVTLSDEGVALISAKAEGKRLAAPVCVARINRKGDADSDRKVTVLDATRIQRWLADLESDDMLHHAAADADGDGQVSILDATHIQRFIAELISEL